MELKEHTAGMIWISDYPVHYAGCDFSARMTVIRLPDGQLVLHSPCDIDQAAADQISALGTPAFIVAPG